MRPGLEIVLATGDKVDDFGVAWGPVAELVGIEGSIVSGVFNLKSSDVGASDRRPRHEERYHEVQFLAAGWRNSCVSFRRLVRSDRSWCG